MATYPDLPAKTSVKPRQVIKTDISEGGTLRAQDFSAAQTYDLEIMHPWIDAADVATLDAFYQANKNTTITTQNLADGENYDCLLILGPEIVEHNGVYRTARQKLIGVRN